MHDSAGTQGVAMYSECHFVAANMKMVLSRADSMDTTEQVQAAFAVWMRAEGYSNPIEFVGHIFKFLVPQIH